MQKYYHKGAFYVDDDSIRVKDDVRKRDATDATLEDKFNKEMLPAVMQVKNFGRAGRYGLFCCVLSCGVTPVRQRKRPIVCLFVWLVLSQHQVHASGGPRHVKSGLAVGSRRQHSREVQEPP